MCNCIDSVIIIAQRSTIVIIQYVTVCKNRSYWYIKTHGSHEVKKKQHAHMSSGLRDHYSELFSQMAALNFKML